MLNKLFCVNEELESLEKEIINATSLKCSEEYINSLKIQHEMLTNKFNRFIELYKISK